MKKIISLFKRDLKGVGKYGNHLVYDEITEGAEWVANGEGMPTQKLDGTCCLIENEKLYKRYEVKKGKTPPANFKPANEIDPVTGKQQGWVAVGEGAEDKWHLEAFVNINGIEDFICSHGAIAPIKDGTYELIGPKIQGNSENAHSHRLVRHLDIIPIPKEVNCPRTFIELKKWLSKIAIEGIVWHHPDGRMVKIKTKDFGLKRTKIDKVITKIGDI